MGAFFTLGLLVVLLIMNAVDGNGIHTTLSTHMVTGSSPITLTCKVTPDARNRQLRYGFAEWTGSERPLNGADDRPTHGPFTYAKVPCGVPAAYCVVVRNDGSQKQDIVNLEQVGDCAEGTR